MSKIHGKVIVRNVLFEITLKRLCNDIQTIKMILIMRYTGRCVSQDLGSFLNTLSSPQTVIYTLHSTFLQSLIKPPECHHSKANLLWKIKQHSTDSIGDDDVVQCVVDVVMALSLQQLLRRYCSTLFSALVDVCCDDDVDYYCSDKHLKRRCCWCWFLRRRGRHFWASLLCPLSSCAISCDDSGTKLSPVVWVQEIVCVGSNRSGPV